MSSSAGPSRVRRPRRSSALTSNGKTLSSTGTDDGARIGVSGTVFVSGDWETMALYLGSVIAKRKGVVPRHGGACPSHPRLTSLSCPRRGCPGHLARRRASRSCPGMTKSAQFSLRHGVETPGQNALLRVEAVFGLVEHDRLRTVDHLIGDFLAAMGGQAVHEDGITLGQRHQLAVDLIG